MEFIAQSLMKIDEIILIIIVPNPSPRCFIHFVLIIKTAVKVVFWATRPFVLISLNIIIYIMF